MIYIYCAYACASCSLFVIYLFVLFYSLLIIHLFVHCSIIYFVVFILIDPLFIVVQKRKEQF
jgi:hypothetical protein